MLSVAIVAAVLCAATMPLVLIFLRRRAVLDLPGHRSSHTVATPRGGGIAVALAVCAAALVFEQSRVTIVAVVAILVAAMLGLAEDLKGVSVATRLMTHISVGLALSVLLISGTTQYAVAVVVALGLLVAAVINAFNFMDGINGISAATGTVAGLFYASVGVGVGEPPLAVLGSAVAGASFAFAPWNLPVARVFLGDVGSYAMGAALAGCLTIALAASIPAEAALAPLTLYLADTGTVLARR